MFSGHYTPWHAHEQQGVRGDGQRAGDTVGDTGGGGGGGRFRAGGAYQFRFQRSRNYYWLVLNVTQLIYLYHESVPLFLKIKDVSFGSIVGFFSDKIPIICTTI